MPSATDDALCSDALRSELIFLPADGSLVPFDGGFVLRTPSNPTYWWGNCVQLDRPPREADFEPLMALFAARIEAVQAASSHRAFGWDGEDRGEIERFVAAGMTHFELVGVVAERGQSVHAPKRDPLAEIVRIAGDDWDSMCALQVETRGASLSAAGYTAFIRRHIDNWRALEANGQGGWFGVRADGRIVSALGVFVEARRGADGRRVGRFQYVCTLPAYRRRGLAGMLVEHATRFAFAQLEADTLRIAADANDVARIVYEGCGYRVRTKHHGLERAS